MCLDSDDCSCYEEFTTGDEKLDLLIKRFIIENTKLREELKRDQEDLRQLREHLGTRIEIEYNRPPLRCGQPCSRCGQIYKGG
jgi:hypothetical protein